MLMGIAADGEVCPEPGLRQQEPFIHKTGRGDAERQKPEIDNVEQLLPIWAPGRRLHFGFDSNQARAQKSIKVWLAALLLVGTDSKHGMSQNTPLGVCLLCLLQPGNRPR